MTYSMWYIVIFYLLSVPMNVPMLYYDRICAILFSHSHFQVGLSRAFSQDAYYLLEIDPWGRRFYHRGGMRTGAAGDVAFSGGSGSTYSDRRVPQTWGISSYSFNLDRSNKYSLTGWWFGRFGLFFHSGNVIIPTDKLIFFRGVGLNHQPDKA